MTRRDWGAEIGRAGTNAAYVEDQVRRLRRRAGRAADDPDRVRQQLTDAEAIFANGDYGNLTLREIATAARRIARHADQLWAASQLVSAMNLATQYQRELRDLQARAERAGFWR